MFLNEQLSQTNVLPVLERLASLDIPLTLTRFFDGLLLKQDVHLMSVNQDTAVFRAEDLKSLPRRAVARSSCTTGRLPGQSGRDCISSPSTPACLSFATLPGASQAGKNALGTAFSRKGRPIARCPANSERLTAAIMDVDAYGIGVLAKSKTGGELGLVEGAPVQLDFTVSPKWKWQRLPGKIVNQAPVNVPSTGSGFSSNRNQARRGSWSSTQTGARKKSWEHSSKHTTKCKSHGGWKTCTSKRNQTETSRADPRSTARTGPGGGQEEGMNRPCFTWRVRSGEQKKLLPVLEFLDRGLELIKGYENSEISLSYLPDENLFRFMIEIPEQPPLTLILLCEVDTMEWEGG